MTTTPATGSLGHSDHHAATGKRLLRQAQEALDGGDCNQALEKTEDAAAHAIKAVAEKWGWPHQDRGRLRVAVEFIAFYLGRENLLILHLSPRILYFDCCECECCEHELDAYTLQVYLNSTQTFVAELEKIRAETAPSFPPPDSLSRMQAKRLRYLTTEPTLP